MYAVLDQVEPRVPSARLAKTATISDVVPFKLLRHLSCVESHPAARPMSSANVDVNRWLFTSTAQASASPRTQASLYFSTNAAQLDQSPTTACGTDWRKTAIHDQGRTNVCVCRDAKIGMRAIRTQHERTTMSVQNLEASAGRFSSTGTPITIRANPVRGGAGHQHGTWPSGGNGLQIDENGRQSLGAT